MNIFRKIGVFKKTLLVLVFLYFQQGLKAQQNENTPVFADPAVVSFGIYNLSDNLIDPNNLIINNTYKLKLLILNLEQGPANVIPTYAAEIRIALGTKLIIDPAFNLASAPFNEYFTWQLINGGTEISGYVTNTIPPDFFAELSFNVKPTDWGSSQLIANFLLPNFNPNDSILSDLNPSNNTASLNYSNTSILPVTIRDFTVKNQGCKIIVDWISENEQNLSRYEVEVSTNGIHYSKAASVAAANRNNYSTSFAVSDQMKGDKLMVRLKSIDIDESFKYSKVVSVPGYCGISNQANYFAYPNPVSRTGNLTIGLRNGLFNGTYLLRIFDQSGKLCNEKITELNNVAEFRLNPGELKTTGICFIDIKKTDGTEGGVIKINRY